VNRYLQNTKFALSGEPELDLSLTNKESKFITKMLLAGIIGLFVHQQYKEFTIPARGSVNQDGFTKDEIKDANKTSRGAGRVGANAIVPRVIKEMIAPNSGITLLDFGAGKSAQHTKALREDGYDVTAYDFGANIDNEFYDENALDRTYDVIYLSNVLNVQSSISMLEQTIEQVLGCMNDKSIVILNYANTPRYLKWNVQKMQSYLEQTFITERIKQGHNVVWTLTKKQD